MIKKILKENIIYIITIVLLTICFVIVKNAYLTNYFVYFDNIVINFFKNINNYYLTLFFIIITNFGDWLIPIIVLLFIFVFYKNKWPFYILTCSYAFSGLLSFITKLLIYRNRPVEALITIPKSYSFPSGHTLTSIVFYITLYYLLSKKVNNKTPLLICSIFLIFCVALSRIYLGVHFFSDVIGGLLLGVVSELMIINIIKKNFESKI